MMMMMMMTLTEAAKCSTIDS
jgi:hypothetical protein